VSSPAAGPIVVVTDDPPPYGVASQSMTWADDPDARLVFVLKDHSAYILDVTRGASTTGMQILEAFQAIAEGRRIKVIRVDFLTIGFWEKMVERKLVHDWGMEDPQMLL
jgi:hypothetical protein